MTDQATSQSDNIVPPRRLKTFVVSVDGTARPYDLSLISLGASYVTDASNDYVYVDLVNDGANAIYFVFSTVTSAALDDTATNAVGTSPLVASAAMGQSIPVGGFRSVRIQRNVDKFLVLKCTGALTSTLRMNASSEPSPSAVR